MHYDDPAEDFFQRAEAAARERMPAAFRDATVTDDVATWCDSLVAAWWPDWPSAPVSPFRDWNPEPAREIPALILLGPPGTGKTWQAYGAIRRIMSTGIRIGWEAARAADLFAALRPRDGVDSEAVYERFSTCPLLLVDDLGATKDSAWTEMTLDRLVDHRWCWWLPTIYTTNLAVRGDDVPSLETGLSDRVYSRLSGATFVSVNGDDRRLPKTRD